MYIRRIAPSTSVGLRQSAHVNDLQPYLCTTLVRAKESSFSTEHLGTLEGESKMIQIRKICPMRRKDKTSLMIAPSTSVGPGRSE